MGRPAIKLDDKQLDQLEALAGMGASNEEIASWFDMSADTLTRRFADRLKKGKLRVKSRLRMAQIQQAYRGNVTMLIWLGKQILGQADKFNVDGDKPTGFEFVSPSEAG